MQTPPVFIASMTCLFIWDDPLMCITFSLVSETNSKSLAVCQWAASLPLWTMWPWWMLLNAGLDLLWSTGLWWWCWGGFDVWGICAEGLSSLRLMNPGGWGACMEISTCMLLGSWEGPAWAFCTGAEYPVGPPKPTALKTSPAWGRGAGWDGPGCILSWCTLGAACYEHGSNHVHDQVTRLSTWSNHMVKVTRNQHMTPCGLARPPSRNNPRSDSRSGTSVHQPPGPSSDHEAQRASFTFPISK